MYTFVPKQVRDNNQSLHSDRQCQLPEILLEPSMNYELSLFCCIPIVTQLLFLHLIRQYQLHQTLQCAWGIA